MARAFIELVGSASYIIRGRKFVRNSPQLITDPDEILFFKNRPGFKVKIEQDLPKPEPKKAEVKRLEKELEKIVEKPKKKVVEPKPEPQPEEEVAEVKKYTKEELLALKKIALLKLSEKLGIAYKTPVKRLKMIETILEKQQEG